MKNLALIFLIGLISGVGARADTPPESKCEGGPQRLAECLDSVSTTEDRRLNAIYSLIGKMLDAGSANPSYPIYTNEKQDLVTAERAWNKFREAQCAAEVSLSGPLSASGSVSITGNCWIAMTRKRISYLEGVSKLIASHSLLCAKTPGVCQTK